MVFTSFEIKKLDVRKLNTCFILATILTMLIKYEETVLSTEKNCQLQRPKCLHFTVTECRFSPT